MRIFKVRLFQRYAKKQKISDKALCKAISEIQSGLVDADYGGHLIKKRIAKQGSGKSGGHRVILAYIFNNRAFFIFGFEKKDKANLSIKEVHLYKTAAVNLLNMTELKIQEAIENNMLFELFCEEEE